jgi:hypothetical protein
MRLFYIRCAPVKRRDNFYGFLEGVPLNTETATVKPWVG